MGAPVQIPGLPPASVANDADLAVIRQGITDFKVTVQKLRNINLAGLPTLSTNIQTSDFMMLARAGVNYRIPFSSVGFVVGTKMWFYMTSGQITASLPAWRIVPNTGDALIGTKGGSVYTTAGSKQGTWTQPGIELSIDQIPAHQHGIPVRFNNFPGHSTKSVLASDSNQIDSLDKTFHTGGIGSAIGSSNPNAYSDLKDTFDPNNTPVQADNTWRPVANVGNICEKIA